MQLRIGLLLGALSLCACGQNTKGDQNGASENGSAAANRQTAETSGEAGSGPVQVGRYVIVHSPQVERDTILLDTGTGKTWSRVELSSISGSPPGWEPMARTDDNEAMSALRETDGAAPLKNGANESAESHSESENATAPLASAN